MASLIFGILAAPLTTDAQRPAKVPRIGVIVPSSGPPASHPGVKAFRQGLSDLGYVEGKSIVLEYRTAALPDQYPARVAELVRLKVDIIVTPTTAAAVAAKEATQTIPIVMAAGPYAVETELVVSHARPGGNVTGLSLFTHELTGKRLELLKEAVSRASRIALFWQQSLLSSRVLDDHQAAARALKLELLPIEIHGDDIDRAFDAAVRGKAQAIILSQGPLFATHRRRFAELALKHRLPLMSGEVGAAEAGSLMYYGSDIYEGWHRAATYVDRVLKGAKPADLPVEEPMKFDLVVNLKTAKALGLTIPQSVLIRADQVIR